MAHVLTDARIAISIHIPRVGDDAPVRDEYEAKRNFNPHPPCGG